MFQRKVLWFIDWQGTQDDFQKVSQNAEFHWEFASQWQDAADKIRHFGNQGTPFSVAFVDTFEKAEWIWKIAPAMQCVVWADANWDWAQNFKKFGQWDKWSCLKKPFTPWEAWQVAKTMSRKWELEQAAAAVPQAVAQEKKILVVDDENLIREIVVDMLSQAGFKVFSASDGDEALQYFDDPNFQVDLLLTDIVMPKVTGIRLAESVSEQHPAVPVVFMSGFPRDSQFQKDVENGQKRFLQKPFSNDTLLRTIQEAFTGDLLTGKAMETTWHA